MTNDSNNVNDIIQQRMQWIRGLVARPIPRCEGWSDPGPACFDRVLIGNKHHAANVEHLLKLGVTAVLNCASGGISRLPVDQLKQKGIRYAFTNVRQDSHDYPILFDNNMQCSKHLEIGKALYSDVLQKNDNGKVLFFCVAGQNRAPTLAIAVLLLYGHSLTDIIQYCSTARPFVLENEGFQKQLVELEVYLKKQQWNDAFKMYSFGTVVHPVVLNRTASALAREERLVEIELLIPGLCTMDVKIPVECTIGTVKQCLVNHANKFLLASESCSVYKSWVVLAMFGYDSMYDFPLDTDAIELSVQLERMQSMFNLKVMNGSQDQNEQRVQWTARCRFALVIFAVKRLDNNIIPWTFKHEERPGAPATLLENNLMSTQLRAWDFVTGQAMCSKEPIVFSYSPDSRDCRSFMQISTSAHEPQQFNAPGEGGILGMGANAIVHRVQLVPTSAKGVSTEVELSLEEEWDAAVKRPFGLSKMLKFLETSSEAGMAKRVRFANALNSDGRILTFYGLGVALSANAYNHQEYKFEAVLLARYEQEFATRTMRRFLEDYIAIPQQQQQHCDQRRLEDVQQLQSNFNIISVKVLLVSLLNAFRDLTLMGVQAFDLNHLNNVLVSQDYQTVKLLDIDGNSKGSIQFPSEYIEGPPSPTNEEQEHVFAVPLHHKPSLDIDLNTVLPSVMEKLLLGKGRGMAFVTNTRSQIWHAKPAEGKEIFKSVVKENFNLPPTQASEKHLAKLAEWFHAMLKRQPPWDNWTNDIYDAMRCIDHLPIT